MALRQPLTMSSREIATLTRKRHDNVAADIRNMLEEVGFDVLKFQDIYLDSRNRQQVEFHLTRELTDTLLTGYSAKLRLAADQAEQLEQQQAALALAAPKVEFVDRYVEADTGAMGFRQVCKLLGANEARFRDFLTSAKVMYLLGGVWTPHAQHMNTGRFVVKTGHAKQNDHVFTQAKFTSKGVEWVSGLWRQECQRLEKMGVK